MDIVVPLLFMAIFYLGPALLKSYNKRQNTPPAVPERLNVEIINPPLITKKIPAYMEASPTKVQSAMVVENVPKIATLVEEQSAWHGKLDQNMITNGVIFAEILQPPRAYRPFIKR